MRLYGAFSPPEMLASPTKHSQPALAAHHHRAGTEHPISSPIPVLKHDRLPVLMMVRATWLTSRKEPHLRAWYSPYQPPRALGQESHTSPTTILLS